MRPQHDGHQRGRQVRGHRHCAEPVFGQLLAHCGHELADPGGVLAAVAFHHHQARQGGQHHVVVRLHEAEPPADELGFGLALDIGLQDQAVVELAARHQGPGRSAGRGGADGVAAAVRQHRHVAGLERHALVLGHVQQASALGDDMERRPAGFRGFVRRGPLRAELAELLEFGPHAQQRAQPGEDVGLHVAAHRESIRRFRIELSTGVWPVGGGAALRRASARLVPGG